MRTITSAARTALAQRNVKFVLLVELDFESGTNYFASGQTNMVWDSNTWLATGDLGSISPLKETVQMQATGYQLALSGIKSALISQALTENYRDRRGYVYVGILDEDLTVLDALLYGQGLMDTQAISEDGKTATIGINLETRLFDFERLRRLMLTQEDQKAIDAADTGLEYVATLENKQVEWGV